MILYLNNKMGIYNNNKSNNSKFKIIREVLKFYLYNLKEDNKDNKVNKLH